MATGAEEILRQTGALLEGHFLLTSGRHSPAYLEKFKVLQHPELTQRLCSAIADHFRPFDVQVVVGPTLGGVFIAYEVARGLGARALYAERGEEGRVIRRSLSIEAGERVLVVDDVMTTGGSIREVIAEVQRWRGELVGVGVLVDRSEDPVDYGVPFFSCHRLHVPSHTTEECPECAAGVPLTRPGG